MMLVCASKNIAANTPSKQVPLNNVPLGEKYLQDDLGLVKVYEGFCKTAPLQLQQRLQYLEKGFRL